MKQQNSVGVRGLPDIQWLNSTANQFYCQDHSFSVLIGNLVRNRNTRPSCCLTIHYIHSQMSAKSRKQMTKFCKGTARHAVTCTRDATIMQTLSFRTTVAEWTELSTFYSTIGRKLTHTETISANTPWVMHPATRFNYFTYVAFIAL